MAEIDDIIKQIAEIPALKQTIKNQASTIALWRDRAYKFDDHAKGWNTINVVGVVSYVVRDRFCIDSDVMKYQFEHQTNGEIEYGAIVYVTGQIIGKSGWEDEELVWLLIKVHSLSVMQKSNSGVVDVTKRKSEGD